MSVVPQFAFEFMLTHNTRNTICLLGEKGERIHQQIKKKQKNEKKKFNQPTLTICSWIQSHFLLFVSFLFCRFSPTRAPSPWNGIRIADKFSPVCPQRLPNIQNETGALEKMPKGRLEYLKRLLPFLQNQSEDCLYLNVFSPAHGMFTTCLEFVCSSFSRSLFHPDFRCGRRQAKQNKTKIYSCIQYPWVDCDVMSLRK